MTSVARYNPPSPHPFHHHHSPSSETTTMQRPPLRHRISTHRTAPLSSPTSIPIPPALIDSPYIQLSSAGPSSFITAAHIPPQPLPRPVVSNTPQLNLLDTVPMGASREVYAKATATYQQELSQGTLGLPPRQPPPPPQPPMEKRRGSNAGLVELQMMDDSPASVRRTPSSSIRGTAPSAFSPSSSSSSTAIRPPNMRESSWHRLLAQQQQQHLDQQQQQQQQHRAVPLTGSNRRGVAIQSQSQSAHAQQSAALQARARRPSQS